MHRCLREEIAFVPSISDGCLIRLELTTTPYQKVSVKLKREEPVYRARNPSWPCQVNRPPNELTVRDGVTQADASCDRLPILTLCLPLCSVSYGRKLTSMDTHSYVRL